MTPFDAREAAAPPAHATDDRDHTVMDELRRQAARTPDSIAVRQRDESVSYRSLMRRVEAWASALRRRGIGPERVVGIAVPRSIDQITAVLAVLRAGAAYVPLDRAYPASRRADILRAAAAAAVISDADAPDAYAEMPTLAPAALDAMTDEREVVPLPTPRQLAYVIYTSGSTGAPKGVAIEHASLLNHMRWMIARFGRAVGERVVQRTSCAFDASVWELFFSLMVGGTLVLLDEDDNRDPEALRTLLVRERPSAVQGVPTFLRFALDRGVFDGVGLGVLFVGGEPLPTDLARCARERSGASVVNLYGPTEATVDTTWFRVEAAPCAGDSRADMQPETQPIGWPIANVWATPVTAGYALAPDGVAAELWIGGAGVGRGYHREPASTARAFVPDPLARQRGRRAYRTGDLVRRDDDGVLTFVGRADRLVKLNGFRVELGEIEATLRGHPGVRDAVAVVRETGPASVLIAYCLTDAGVGWDAEAIRAHLAARLPHYMMPAQIVPIDRFPIKPNGKLDTAALPLPPPTASIEAEPATEVERVLVEIYQGLFKRPIGVLDNFFDIGGDSIRSIQVITLAKARGLTLRLQDIFDCPTIRGLAARVGPAAGVVAARRPFEDAPERDRARLTGMDLEDAYPTSVLLDALYFLNETSPRYEVYVTSCELGAAWDPNAFRRALAPVLARHAWLRTSFAHHEFSRPLQLVHREVPIAWTFEDMRGQAADDQDRALLAWIDREKTRKFDWRQAPVWRIAIHQRAADRFQLTLSEPVFDGWSVSSFLGELIVSYAASLRGEAIPTRPVPRASYRDFIVAEQHALDDRAAVAFWQRASADVGRALPRRRREPLVDRGGQRLEQRWSAEASARLREAGRRVSAPLKSVLLAAHVRVLATLIGRSRLVSGVIMNGRAETPEAEQVLGLHINTVPLVFDLAASRTWLDLIAHVFTIERQAVPHRRYPLGAMQKRHGRTPLFDAAFNFTHFHGLAEALRVSGVPVLRYLALDQTFFPLTAQFHVDVNESTVGLGLDYDSSEFSSAQMEEIASLYRTALDQIASNPERSFKGALAEASPIAGRLPAPDDSWRDGVLGRFWHIATRQPDRLALTFADQQVSYGALAAAASALAAQLRAADVTGRGVLVCFETQHQALVALLAVMEAGAVYVPLDPAAPPARMTLIARNADVRLALCDVDRAASLRGCGVKTLGVDVEELVRASRAATAERRQAVRPSGVAYRLYTSGTTGVPKGVEVGHDALVHFLRAMQDATGFASTDIVPGITTIAFDISLLEMLMPITTGARLTALSREICRDGVRLGHALRDAQATFCQATPTTWRMLLDSDAPPTAGLSAGLTAVSGGEALAPDLAARLLASGLTLYNAYGPTETTIWSAVGRVDRGQPIRLGAPLGATRLRVADPFDHDTVAGAAGEILIGGPGLALGYVGNPALTAERFVPLAGAQGERAYRTGDAGWQTSEGSIAFLGRADDQIKLRGYRIELAEIEQAIRTCPRVRDAAVTVAGTEAPILCGYVLLDDERDWDQDAAADHLRRSLPDYMIPRQWMVLDAFPLTANQKVDRARLPAPVPRGGARILELFEQVKAMPLDDVKQALADQR